MTIWTHSRRTSSCVDRTPNTLGHAGSLRLNHVHVCMYGFTCLFSSVIRVCVRKGIPYLHYVETQGRNEMWKCAVFKIYRSNTKSWSLLADLILTLVALLDTFIHSNAIRDNSISFMGRKRQHTSRCCKHKQFEFCVGQDCKKLHFIGLHDIFNW